MIPSDMKQELLRIRTVGSMAVVALTVGHGIFNYRKLIEITEVPLVNAHFAVDLISGSDTTVGETPLVKRIFTYVDMEVFVLKPLAVYFRAYRHSQLLSSVLFGELMPLLDVEVSVFPVGMQFLSVCAFYRYVNTFRFFLLIQHGKIEGRDFRWNSHIYIIGEYLRKRRHLFNIMRMVSTSPQCKRYQQ